jgi:single-strand DNA-binding protein
MIGRLGEKPELRKAGEHDVCNLRLAVPRDRKVEGQPDTDWIDVVCWAHSARFVCTFLDKGSMLGLSGRLQVREWKTKDGDKRRSVEVVAENVYGLDKRGAKTDAEWKPPASGQDDFDPFAGA